MINDGTSGHKSITIYNLSDKLNKQNVYSKLYISSHNIQHLFD